MQSRSSNRPAAWVLRILGFLILVVGLAYGAFELTMPSISLEGFTPTTPAQRTTALVVMVISVLIGFALLIAARRIGTPTAKR
jgi:TRAP-type C4-dicarboxylate transport system permease small subunit